ncbi:hypothetical protein KM043_005000 [Ampulex compressa]|nr:hypothetical protein KM043_005000 [Ampulex compressa]
MSDTKDFSCVGGLEKHIRVVKEMVLFPLMYGEVYEKFNLKPPRGLLFYGPPGTGKTLVASALAAECSNSERKVSFISRKGSDCLSKWVGESERKLQKVFTLAQQTKPCIIFFDEVDGLAPVRSSRQDFVHASVVSTLLALMDGLENNSEIIVIGATNRIDAIDPALRRPGRFDRELYFPLPGYNGRKDILSVHIKSWKQKPPQKFLAYLASKTIGYCGSDLQALCAEAVEKQDFLKAQQNIVPASQRVVIAPVKSLSPKIQPMLEDKLSLIVSRLDVLCPPGMLTSDTITGKATSRSASCPRMLLCGDDDSHTRHLGPALLYTLEHLPCHILDVTKLFEDTGRAAGEAIIQAMKTARRSLPSLLYVPDILAWWDLVDEAARVVFASLMQGLDRSVHMLVLTTANCQQEDIPPEIASLYDEHQGELFEVKPPDMQERQSFFKQLFLNSASDINSNRSSQVDFVQLMSPTRSRGDGGRKLSGFALSTDPCHNSVADGRTSRKIRTETRAHSKLYAVKSSHSGTAPKSRVNVKRINVTIGEGPPSKRQKSVTTVTGPCVDRLTDLQIQELLDKIVQATEQWSCHQLESLYAALELTLDKNTNDLYTAVDECLKQFQNLRKIKVETKMEPN